MACSSAVRDDNHQLKNVHAEPVQALPKVDSNAAAQKTDLACSRLPFLPASSPPHNSNTAAAEGEWAALALDHSSV